MEIDVFISYSSKEFNKALLIKEALSENDISVWMAPESIPIGSNYTKEIPVAIKNCKIFLLILSQNAQNSIWVPAEVENAYKNEKLIFPFIIEDCPLTEQFDFLLSMSQKIEAAQPPIEHRISELVEKVLLHLGRKQIIDKTNTGKTEYQLSTMKIYADKNFKGRDAELDIIHKNLMSDKNKFFIVGMGGCGKSELANRYCEKHSNDYENIIKITYSGSLKESIANDSPLNICGIVRNENLDKSVDEYFEYKLNVLKNITDERTLLVIDNFDVSEDEKLDELCSGRFAILFTTRNRVINNRFEQLLLDEVKLDTNEQFELFKDFYQIELEQDEIEIIMEILTLLDGHILSIRLVASTMNSNCIEPDEMLDILKNVGASKQSDVVYSRINKLMQLSQLSEEELYLLKNLSLVPLSGIKKKTFIEWCGKEDFETINGLIQKSWVIRDNKDVIHLHPIISDLAFEELSNNFGLCDNFLHALTENCEEAHKLNYKNKQWLIETTNYLCDKFRNNSELCQKMLMSKARMLNHLSRYGESIALYESILRYRIDRETKRLICARLAHLYCLSGFPEKALENVETCISEFFCIDVEKMTPEELYIYKGVITRRVEANRHLGNYDIAISDARKVLEVYLKGIDNELNRSILWGKYHLARALYMRGLPLDIEESEKHICEAIELCESEKSYWDKDFCIELLAQIQMKQGKYEQAIENMKLAYESITNFSGKIHVGVAVNRVFLGNIYRTMGNETEAVKCYNEAIEIFHKCGTFKLEDNARCILNSGKIGYVS
ncbi:MAG: TIR domain-containing protein [Clostridia bacterium]|nr:TIR domain-containing protein [Clostridia bacterium]